MHGWIILDKPVGLGSTQAVAAVKRALRVGGYPKLKVGHGGTLDPLASGVLPVAIGEATKLAGRLLDSDKAYEFTVRFGAETSTLDTEGEVIATSEVRPKAAEIEATLGRFTGSLQQVPPAFSALKIDGERAYDLARKGMEVALAARQIIVRSLSAATPAYGDEPQHEVTLTAEVSKGTYIRSLARDIAHALGTVGHVTMLRRIKAGPFTLDHAITLDKLADQAMARRLEDACLPLRAGLDDIPALSLTPDQADLLRKGQQVIGIAAPDGLVFAMLGETPIALAEGLDGNVRVVRGFNL